MPFTARRRAVSNRTRIASITAATALACLVASSPASAVVLDLPAGEACPDFDVRLDIGEDSKRNTRTFQDRDGNSVVVVTGAAESVVVSRLEGSDAVESVTVPARGARTRTTTATDGTSTVEFTGHLLLVLFSSDLGGSGLTPSSTTLISGRTVFTVDENGVFTVQSVTGRTADICAALAP
jgi:hypothetical protein